MAGFGDVGGKVLGAEWNEAAKIADFVFAPPLSVYGSSVMLPILKETTGVSETLQWKILPGFWLLVNSFVQIIFMKGLYDISRAAAETMDDSTCEELDPWILSASIWVFIVVILTDLQQTTDMLELYCKRIKTVPRTKVLKFREVEGSMEVVDGGFSLARKIAIFVFVVLPKFGYALFLLALGVTYLGFSATNAEVILNCTALVFIIDIDEFIFNLFSLAQNRHLLESCPPFVVKDNEMRSLWYWWRPLAQPIKLAVSCLILWLSMDFSSRCGYQAPGGIGMHDDVMAVTTTTAASLLASGADAAAALGTGALAAVFGTSTSTTTVAAALSSAATSAISATSATTTALLPGGLLP
mmetsp:Transcript_124567/g.360231  ORF Transcript_124567/g.360231 Transcript_124567/m.360231 type:complete len:355 (+) Transcript_124567:108-1172(+)